MGSRRMTTRSTSWNGRSTNGDENGGSSRPGGGCSYLSNVRPENRHQLIRTERQTRLQGNYLSMEESEIKLNLSFVAILVCIYEDNYSHALFFSTCPETHLYRIISDYHIIATNMNRNACNGARYPAPQVNWYKDDMQLDRYCGLPKYEIFRNGQSHSLHIYNCTVEDAAIYQASAINSKGIVSCSGVLEVGEMNEFKIHQRYFAKIKQKAELKRREAEGKENQEPLRTISPDRTLRKRRSTMEAFLSTPSSTEDESNEDGHQAVAVNPEDRLQEATVEEVGEKPITNGQVVNENGNNSGTYIYDSVQKIFTAHQPKTPFVKKKIKISNVAKVAKADTLGERVSEERRARDETLASASLARIDPVLSKRNLDEVMEVERPDSSMHVKQAHTMMNRNDAPVNPKLPRDPCTMDAHQPQKSSSESKATTDDILTPSLHCGLQAAIDKMTQGTQDHSRGSNQSPVVLFTDLQNSPFESPDGAENSPGCNVSPTTPQSQVDTAIKTVEGTEIQVDEEVEGNKVAELLVEAPNEKIFEMETETIALCMVEHTKTENTKDVVDKDAESITVDASWKEKNKTMSEELASGARRKIQIPKAKPKEPTEATSPTDNLAQKKELSTNSVTPSGSPSLSRRSHLLQPAGEQTSLVERRSPLLSRRKTASETQSPNQQPTEVNTVKTEVKPTEKDKHDPFKAPQVIRKIRGETFADASGHFKLWCQFFNVLSDSTIKWYKNEEEIAQIKRNAGDETQVNLAIVQASRRDSGVYRCSIMNEYGTDSTDTLLSMEILAGMSLREDLGVGEEIEMTPLIFSKGVADSGIWANKLFGRIMMQESHIGDGCSHKVWRAKVIYGLEPVFESGDTCIIKVRNPIAYSGKEESCVMERNLDIIKQECKIQNLAREYCKIFSAEARVIENFGPCLEVVPVYLIYRPANTVPYATVEADLTGVYQKYSVLDHTGRLDVRMSTVVEQKCCALQHWIFQWTNGNLLLTRLEGVDTKITNVGISVKSTGHQAVSVEGNPKVFEQFVSQHQCNYFCGLLGLRSLKVMDTLLTPAKPKGSRSPLLQRKMAAGSSSPQTGRKAAGSPRLPRKAEQEGRKTPTKQKEADAPKVVKMA
ncbi:hypothetical protein INR49_016272 [Caranx melampygus]|nr:hypothetical protein INR49_016272 [Caranx melampygus]